MRTTKQLAAHLRMLAGWHREDKGKLMTIEAMEEAADRLEELDAEGWQDVVFVLPPAGAPRMACNNIGVVFDNAVCDEEGNWYDEDSNRLYDITHWRPRPAPPMPGQSGGGE